MVLVLSTRYLSENTIFKTQISVYLHHVKFLTTVELQGQLSDGTWVAVKQLSSKSRQGNREFLNEIGMISCFQHPNLVKLHGCCIEGDQLILVYEYMENNSLARALFSEFFHISTMVINSTITSTHINSTTTSFHTFCRFRK